jgi:ornithine cyclodeaminase/alanine dehydrogenase-like protein (mu-crystallin family)
MTGGLLFIDEATVARHLNYASLIPAMERALIALSSGRAVQPVRTSFEVQPHGGVFFAMPAYAGGLGLKVVTLYPGNAAKGMHTHFATILLMRPETGEPLAVIEATRITAMRTAAVSAAATKLLADPAAEILAVLGSGVQAQSHLEAIKLVRPIREARIWSRTPANVQRLATATGARACACAEDAIRGADIVVTATSSRTPVLKGEWLKPSAHVNAVGAPRPDWRELDDEVLRGTVYVDSRAGALRESGDIIGAKAIIHAELGEALAGLAPPAPKGVHTLFKSLGLAVEDIAAAEIVYRAVAGDS